MKMMKAISHPAILELEEIFEGDNYIYTISQLYSGPKLSNVILDDEQYILDDKVSSIICLRLLEALAHLESRNIIHRDLKPDNIVFRSNQDLTQPVLVDLGFATLVPDYACLFTRCGTPGYVAPEVLLDMPYDSKADVFSLGVTIYMILNRGINPFMSEDYQKLVDNNAAGVVDYSCIADRWLTPLIQQMLVPQPGYRPSASQLLQAYSQILETGPNPVSATSQSSPAKSTSQTQESRSLEIEIDELQLAYSNQPRTGDQMNVCTSQTAIKNLDVVLSEAQTPQLSGSGHQSQGVIYKLDSPETSSEKAEGDNRS
jgi:serine/threonine protein kinase